jgi:hypothetical protein
VVVQGRILISASSCAVVSAFLFGIAPVAVAAPSSNVACGTVRAAPWKTGGKSGNTWLVTAAPPTGCGLAKAGVAMLTKERSEVTSQMKVTPHGYVCTGKPIGALPLRIVCIPKSGKGGFDITATGYHF